MKKNILISLAVLIFLIAGNLIYAWRNNIVEEPEPLLQNITASVDIEPQPQNVDIKSVDELKKSLGLITSQTKSIVETQQKLEAEAAAKKAAEEAAALAAAKAAIFTFDCSELDCFYAAVDKSHALPSSYSPSTTTIAGKSVSTQSAPSLQAFIDAIKAAGIDVVLTSAYRSYSTQESTFNNWVKIVKSQNPGFTQAQAEAEANTFSALPGQSEHQLGTTADLNTAGATAFDAIQNKTLYDFIENNAHLYGFVITYPKNQQSITGYVHEPWHVRYLGVDLATELFNTGYVTGNGNNSTKFLRDKGLSP